MVVIYFASRNGPDEIETKERGKESKTHERRITRNGKGSQEKRTSKANEYVRISKINIFLQSRNISLFYL